MLPPERTRLIYHLDDQAKTLASMTAAALNDDARSTEPLAAIAAQVVVMRETLETLGAATEMSRSVKS